MISMNNRDIGESEATIAEFGCGKSAYQAW